MFAEGIGTSWFELQQSEISSRRVQGISRDEPLRFDVLVEDCVLVEVKAVEKVLPIHKAQLLSYLKLMNVPLGLLINFHEAKVTDGVSRVILRGADE